MIFPGVSGSSGAPRRMCGGAALVSRRKMSVVPEGLSRELDAGVDLEACLKPDLKELTNGPSSCGCTVLVPNSSSPMGSGTQGGGIGTFEAFLAFGLGAGRTTSIRVL